MPLPLGRGLQTIPRSNAHDPPTAGKARSHRTVWVTRDEPAGGPLAATLRVAGLSVLHEPVLTRNTLTDAADQIAALTRDDWLVLTSAFAIGAVAGRVAKVPRVAVVGNASRRAAESRGFRVVLVGRGDATSLFEELFAHVGHGVICYPRSSETTVPKPPPGVNLVSPVLYQTVPRPFRRTAFADADIIAVTSPTAVRAIGHADLPFASIGPLTSAALRENGITPCVEAPQRSFQSLATAIARYVEDSRHQRA